MAMLEIGPGSLPVLVSINGGLASRIENLDDVGRAIGGGLLITQLTSTAGARKDTLSCTTIPLDDTAKDALVTALTASAIIAVAGDIGARNAAARITGVNPAGLPGARRWIVTFDLIEA